MPGEYDKTTVCVSDDGERRTFAQIAFASQKDPGVDVEETEDGYLVNGTEFTPDAEADREGNS